MGLQALSKNPHPFTEAFNWIIWSRLREIQRCLFSFYGSLLQTKQITASNGTLVLQVLQYLDLCWSLAQYLQVVAWIGILEAQKTQVF